MAVKSWLKLALDISWAWISLSIIRAVYQPSQDYWVILNRMMQVGFSTARPVTLLTSIPEGPFCIWNYPLRGKAVLTVHRYQFSREGPGRTDCRESVRLEGFRPSILCTDNSYQESYQTRREVHSTCSVEPFSK